VGLGYVTVPSDRDGGAIDADGHEINVADMRQPATAPLRPLYDPKNERIKC
jgi:hypothetical protein